MIFSTFEKIKKKIHFLMFQAFFFKKNCQIGQLVIIHKRNEPHLVKSQIMKYIFWRFLPSFGNQYKLIVYVWKHVLSFFWKYGQFWKTKSPKNPFTIHICFVTKWRNSVKIHQKQTMVLSHDNNNLVKNEW
jgi:hypothetical protein